MPTPIHRRAIHDDLNPAWDAAEHSLRCAMEVVDWCANEYINLAGLEARDLDIAMGEMPAERQSPADFLDMACALAAVRRAQPQSVNAELLAIARQYASECGDCDGTGVTHTKQWPGGIEVDGEKPCEACEDIRKVLREIDRAEFERLTDQEIT